jgi:hypothetical protein
MLMGTAKWLKISFWTRLPATARNVSDATSESYPTSCAASSL